jgi:glycosyltransferase involved in cell wall biosynthesis
MASGRPVIVTRTTSLPELVLDGETGFIVEPHDRAALRDRIERLMGDHGLAQRMGTAGRLHVETLFTWDRVARRGLELYATLG